MNCKSKASYRRSMECDSENTKTRMIPPMTDFSLAVKKLLKPFYAFLLFMKNVRRARNRACMPRSIRNLVNLRIVRYSNTLE